MNQKLPNATATLVLGILSIVTCCCAGVPGVICGIIALVISKKDLALYKESPESFTNYGNLNAGRIMAFIGLALSAINFVWTVVRWVFYSDEMMQQYDQIMEQMQSGGSF